MEQSKVALTVQEFCNLYGVGRSYTYDEIKAGHLRVRKAGKRTLIRRTDADAWLNALPGALQAASSNNSGEPA